MVADPGLSGKPVRAEEKRYSDHLNKQIQIRQNRGSKQSSLDLDRLPMQTTAWPFSIIEYFNSLRIS